MPRTSNAYRFASSVSGWLTEIEANTIRTVCSIAAEEQRGALVEAGSWHGRSTIYLADMLDNHPEQGQTLYCIDPHEGVITKGKARRPSLDAFNANLRAAGLDMQIDLVQKPVVGCDPADWGDRQIGFLFHDALHDYQSVMEDMLHLAGFLADGALVCFHDYGNSGVTRAVRDLQQTGLLTLLSTAGTVAVCRARKK